MDGGWLHPDFHPAASRGRALRLHATPGHSLRTEAEITVPATGCYQLVTDWVLTGASVNAELWNRMTLLAKGRQDSVVRWPGPTLGLPAGPLRVSLAIGAREALLDRLMLLRRPPSLDCTAHPLKKR